VKITRLAGLGGGEAVVRADVIFRNAVILTGDDARPRAGLLAVFAGRVLALDGDAEGLDAARVVDLGGAVVVPGFHDAHAHTAHFGLSLDELDLSSPPLGSLDELYAAVAAQAAVQPPGTWLVGAGYDQNKLGAHPTRAGLDAVAGDHLVWLKHTSGHMCVVNSAVLERIGPVPQAVPEGGVAELDERGEPTGLLQEQAQNLVRDLVRPYPAEMLAGAIGRAHQRYLAEGITSVCDAGVGGGWIGHSGAELAAYQLARESGRLAVRTTVMVAADVLHPVSAHPGDGITAGLDLGLRTGLGDEWLRIGAVKVFADGSLIGRTCSMHEPFAGAADGNRGYLQAPERELREVITAAHRAGWQVATHAIGDAAVDLVLDIYAGMLARWPRPGHRHRIEHCGVTSQAALARIAALGVIPVPQGRFTGVLGDGMAAALGPARTRQAYRLRSFLAAGIPLPGSSDRPVVDGAPLAGIADMVTRRTETGAPFGPEEAITPAQALRAYTSGSAYATFTEADRGTLAPGKLADFAVLSGDPTATDPARIPGITVLATVVGGQIRHDAAGFAGPQTAAYQELQPHPGLPHDRCPRRGRLVGPGGRRPPDVTAKALITGFQVIVSRVRPVPVTSSRIRASGDRGNLTCKEPKLGRASPRPGAAREKRAVSLCGKSTTRWCAGSPLARASSAPAGEGTRTTGSFRCCASCAAARRCASPMPMRSPTMRYACPWAAWGRRLSVSRRSAAAMSPWWHCGHWRRMPAGRQST
jgi:predicted amidohydrolase YtcJ